MKKTEYSAMHKIKYLGPRVDFFEKHESQISI